MSATETTTDLIAPMDEHNTTLVANAHPQTWTNPTPSGRYNLVVIGGGTAGLVTALGAAGIGAKVALVERHLLGGDCLNVGCVPSKAIIKAARVARTVRHADEFGVRTSGDVNIDFAAVMERMRKLRADISFHDSAERLTKDGVDVFLGDAIFTDDEHITVGDAKLHFKKAVIATGARAVELPIEGLDRTPYLTNETLFELTERPQRLAVIGGGPIGSEMAQAFARLGSEVVLFERSDRVLSKDDAEASRLVMDAMRRDGVRIVPESEIEKVEPEGSQKRVHFKSPGGSHSELFDELLLGVGRAPNVEGLGLETVNVEFDTRDGVQVDDRLQTTNSRIYACGDVCSQYKFTHAADFMARTVIRNALFFGRGKLSALTIPRATYTSPELAHVGLTEAEAKQQNIDHRTFTQSMDHVDRAILDGETEGFAKVVVDKKGRILGATIVSETAGDLISEITTAMTNDIRLGSIANVIHPYPTQAEVIRKLGDQYNKTRLTPTVATLFKKWLKLTR